MNRARTLAVLLLTAAALATPDVAARENLPHAGMLRYPDVSARQIVFSYGNGLWVVSRDGGVASPVADPPGGESFPRFSPDGATIAFVGNYDGNRDLYTIPLDGGVPHRVTHHPAGEVLCDWTPAGALLFFTNGHGDLRRQQQLFEVPAAGGLPSRLPVPYGANGSTSSDGQWLAYTPNTRDHRTWKRYRGGLASDIWLFNLRTLESRQVTDWEGTDSQPMFHGAHLYYMSDAGPAHRLNIWSYDPSTGGREQITHFRDFDVKWPAMGPGPDGGGEIVFQRGTGLHLLDLPTRQTRRVQVSVPGARAELRVKRVDASEHIQSWNVSPTGKRVVMQARGDVWTLPATKGPARNLTRTSGAAEREPTWSPDGRSIAYFSDATGEYELYVRDIDGPEAPRRLTTDGAVYRYAPTWSPDSKQIAFTDKTGTLFRHVVETGETREVGRNAFAEQPRMAWSHDSHWIAYSAPGDGLQNAIWLYDVASGVPRRVTSGMFDDSSPVFDRKGDYLYYVSARQFTAPLYEDVGTTFVYAGTQRLVAAPLRSDVKAPFLPESDEEDASAEKDEEKKGNGKQNGKKKDDDPDGGGDGDEKNGEPKEPLRIDLDGFERRAVVLPAKAGRLSNLAVTDGGQLVYTRGTPRGDPGKPSIQFLDPSGDEPEEKTVIEGVGQFRLSADGEKLLVRKQKKFAVVDAKPKQKLEKTVPLDGMTALIQPREEWRQMFTEAWRIQRDFFYDPTMHGVDWPAMRTHYAQMLPDCTSREDVSFVIRELISELNVGHAYYWGGDVEDSPSVSVGTLGVDWSFEGGAYRIKRMVRGAAWDADARGPLDRPGVDAKEGDYLLSVNGAPVDAAKDPWAAFQGLAGKTVTLTLADDAAGTQGRRDVVIDMLANDTAVRYRSWVEKNRARVAERTGGRVGYIHVPDTGRNGQNELFRQFYGQMHLPALVIDERWNGGGQIPTRFIELLNRPTTNYWARRDGRDWPWPYDSHQGPKCMLINGNAGSGGDAFPAYFRHAGLGKLIGTRTWGGLVGISGNPGLIDGGYTAVPTFAFYETDGTWGIEGHGVDPDIEVVDDPALHAQGYDPQLEAAIDHMLEELERIPYQPPRRPGYPDRSGMGLPVEDR